MSEATPAAVEVEVRRLSRRLEAKSDELAELFHAAGEAEAIYRVELAKATLRSEQTSDKRREADAMIQCEKLLLDRKTKEAVADAAKEAARHTASQLNAVQSIGAMVRESMRMAR